MQGRGADSWLVIGEKKRCQQAQLTNTVPLGSCRVALGGFARPCMPGVRPVSTRRQAPAPIANPAPRFAKPAASSPSGHGVVAVVAVSHRANKYYAKCKHEAAQIN